jgi:cytochrome P450
MSVNELPYLDAVVHEILRLHPPVGITTRVVCCLQPPLLSQPIVTSTGETITSIVVAKGATVTVPIRASNRLEAFWGEDAKTFRPERWLEKDNDDMEFNAIQGHRHLLTFVDGPRICLGKNFALAEFKVNSFEILGSDQLLTETRRR